MLSLVPAWVKGAVLAAILAATAGAGYHQGASVTQGIWDKEKAAIAAAEKLKESEREKIAAAYESTIAKQSAQIRANQKRLSNVVQKSYFGCVVNPDLVGLWNENYGIAAKPAK